MNQSNNSDNKALTNQTSASQSAEPPTPESIIQELIEAGMSEIEARQTVESLLTSAKEDKARLAKAIQQAEKQQSYGEIAAGASLFVAIFASFMDSYIGYAIAVIVAGVAGYFANPAKAWAGIAGFISGIIVFLIANHYYFLNRRSFLRIEIIIPMIPGVIALFLVRGLINSILYSHDDE